MKYNKGFIGIGIIIAIVAALVVGGGAVYFSTKTQTPPKNTGENNYQPQENQNSLTNINDSKVENIKTQNQIKTGYEITNIKELISGGDNSLGDPSWDYQPNWSPDGNKILITGYPSGIYVKYINDNKQKFLTNDGSGAGLRYNWSPDSKAIVYLSKEFKNGQQNNIVKLIEIETGKIIELKGGIGSSYPCFTSTNEIIYSYKGTLIKRKWDGVSIGKEEIIAQDVPANVIVSSPNGNKLVIENDEGINIIDYNGGNKKIIVKNGEKDFGIGAKFSADGNNILFSNNVGSKTHFFVYSISNEKIIDLGEGSNYQWLPNNNIIYNIVKDNGDVITGSEIYVINLDGTGKTQITNTKDKIELDLAVSPDGKFIVYRDENKRGSMYIGELK